MKSKTINYTASLHEMGFFPRSPQHNNSLPRTTGTSLALLRPGWIVQSRMAKFVFPATVLFAVTGPIARVGAHAFIYKTSLAVIYRSDLHNSHLEATWIAIGGEQHQHLVGCLYRPPNATADFWGHLDTVLHNAATITPSMTLVGDFNINLAQCMTIRPHQRFWDLIGSYGLRNYVQSATLVTPRCPDGTLLDLVLSTVGTISHCEVVPCTISDHFLVHASLSLPASQHPLQRKSSAPHPQDPCH